MKSRIDCFFQNLTLIVFAGLFCIGLVDFAVGQENQETQVPKEPVLAEASDEGEAAIAAFKIPEGIDCKLFAAEPMVGNPVAIHVDHQGKLFVAETYRQEKGVEDNRRHGHWMDEELAAQTVADRIAYIRKYIENADEKYTEHDDRIRLLQDTDKDGVADSTTVFANRFNDLEMGTGAGVLSYRGGVYYTCIPDLFLLKDADNDGVADVRKSLHTGYGVRFAFRGHDMHGLIVGPDGRLYFSIGDRGYNVDSEDENFTDPASGAVFRCELDGSNLEVVATGLRNPQELAFDNFGNLFTGDNNSDSGDKARWVNVVRGSDSGWRMYYQYLNDRGPFNREKVWYPYNKDETPAYIVPPILNISDGPSGLAFYPGTGMNEFFKDRFLLCDFRGNATVSGIRTFRNKAKGAFWEITDSDKTFWNMLITDAGFGPDGKLYASDWVFGWNGENKGRVYTFENKEASESELVKQTQKLLAEGMDERDATELIRLLGHPDRRVRMESQFALVDDKDEDAFVLTAKSVNRGTMARLHSIWGLGQLARTNSAKAAEEANGFSEKSKALLYELVGDKDAAIRNAVAQVLGESGSGARELVERMLEDENHRVRYSAAMALAKIGNASSMTAIEKMLVANDNEDPMLRHGGIMAMAGILGRMDSRLRSGIVEMIANDRPAAVRLALVVAVRKLHNSIALRHLFSDTQLAGLTKNLSLQTFLSDKDPMIVLEAARAVHDLPINEDMAALAAVPFARCGERSTISGEGEVFAASPGDALLRRIINANFIQGEGLNATRLAEFAMDTNANMDRRSDAVKALAGWAQPEERDRVLGDWRPKKARSADVARAELERCFAKIASEPKLTGVAMEAAGKLGLKSIAPSLMKIALNEKDEVDVRASAIDSLTAMKFDGLGKLVDDYQSKIPSKATKVDNAVCRAAASYDEKLASELLQKVFAGKKGDRSSIQEAFETIGGLSDKSSADFLTSHVTKLMSGNPGVSADVILDLLEAAGQRSEPDVTAKVKEYWTSVTDPKDGLKKYQHAMTGGDYERGKKIFLGKTEVSCVRCHKVDGEGGEVGPDLSSIGLTRDRKYLLEAIVLPNAQIAEGFTQQVIVDIDGVTHTGIVTEENDQEVKLMDADGKVVSILKDDIEGRKQGKSSMPTDLVDQLTQKEVRDLVEFLIWKKAKPAGGEGEHGEK